MGAMSTEAEVCNLALVRVGQRALLDSLDEETTEAELCQAVFANSRDEVLEAARWDFATRRASLTLLREDVGHWAYAYTLPGDWLASQYLDAGSGNAAADEQLAFAVELDGTSNIQVLLTDVEDAELVYTCDNSPVVTWTASFRSAVAWRIACELVLGLPVKPQYAAQAERGYAAALMAATARHRNAKQPRQPPSPTLITARQ